MLLPRFVVKKLSKSSWGRILSVAMLILAGPLHADVTVTQLANEGVILSDGQVRIMIDGMVVEPYSVYGGLDEPVAADFKRASGAFAGIDLALSSHRHHDHNQPTHACQFMKASKGTRFVSSPQVLSLMREQCGQLVATSERMEAIDPQYGEPVILEGGGYKVTVFPLSHGAGRFAKIQNYGHLIELGGLKILHIGDASMSPADFKSAGLERVELDVALIPYWYFQPGPGPDIMNRFMNAPYKRAVHIPPGKMADIKAHIDENYPHVVILEKPLEEADFRSANWMEP